MFSSKHTHPGAVVPDDWNMAGDQVFSPFEEIKRDLLEQAKAIQLASNAFMGKNRFMHAMHQEIFLLSKYFLTNPSLQAFRTYRKFIQNNKSLYAARKQNWGKYSSTTLDGTSFSFADTLESIEQSNAKYHSQWLSWFGNIQIIQLEPNSLLMLLLTLPHLDSTEIEKINQKIRGFTLLYRIIANQEKPINILCVLALLDCGANPNIRGEGFLCGIDLDVLVPT